MGQRPTPKAGITLLSSIETDETATGGRNLGGIISAGVSIASVLVVGFLLLFGQGLLGLDGDGVSAFLEGIKGSPWAFFAVALLFCGLALTGFPQALLFAGTAAVFGGPLGALYGWGATMVSSAMTFWLGRAFGGHWVKRISAARAQTLIQLMQRRGVLASMIVRWTPSAPFIVVNAACGSSGMAYWKFALGTGLGILPKIAIISFFTDQLDSLVTFFKSGDPTALISLALIAVLWVAFLWGCRLLYRRLKTTSLSGLSERTVLTESYSTENGDSGVSLNDKSKAP